MKFNTEGPLAIYLQRWPRAYEQLPNNACSLYWTIFWCVIAHLATGVALGMAVPSAVYVIMCEFVWGVVPESWSFLMYMYGSVIVVGGSLVAVIVGIMYTCFVVIEKFGYRDRKERQWRVNAREAWRALKDKYCPLVEWEGD